MSRSPKSDSRLYIKAGQPRPSITFNMALFTLLAVLCLAATVSAETGAEMKTRIFNDCAEQFKVPQKGLEDVFNMISVEGVKGQKCFTKCVFDSYEVMDGDKLDLKKFTNAVFTDWTKPEDQKKLTPIINDCYKKVKPATDPCQYSYDVTDCFMKSIKDVREDTTFTKMGDDK